MPVQMQLSRIIISEIHEQQVIYLKEMDGERQFPILIGLFEATSIDRHVKDFTTPRPLTHDLLVKEHGIALATRSPRFYRQLLEMPGVRLVHPAADIFGLTRNADLVVTVTGTAAYEASLLGRRAATVTTRS